MKVTSKKNISFPKLNWGINKGEEKELPNDENKQKKILKNKKIIKINNKLEE